MAWKHALVPVLWLLACGAPPEQAKKREPLAAAPAAAPTATPVAEAPPPELRATMHQDLLRAVAIREAVISGELADTRAPARWLAEQALDVPEAWKPHVAAMQRVAREVVDAADIKAAARATGQLARQCGECHRSVGARHDMSFPPEPPKGKGAQSAMVLHQWAAERLYQGLVSNNDEAWRAGAAALVEAPLHVEEITADVELPEDLHGLAGTVRQLGARASGTTDAGARAEIYGELIGSCAACHKGGC